MALEQLLSDEFVAGITDALAGDGFCGMQENAAVCAKIIHELIPYALPAIAGSIDEVGQEMLCNMAISDTCPAL